MGFNLKKREFLDALKLRYDWPGDAILFTCVCSDAFTTDHAICKRGGFVTQRNDELRDLETELLNMQQLGRGSNQAPDARLDIHAGGFSEKQRSP